MLAAFIYEAVALIEPEELIPYFDTKLCVVVDNPFYIVGR
jgi:hypothetical protein